MLGLIYDLYLCKYFKRWIPQNFVLISNNTVKKLHIVCPSVVGINYYIFEKSKTVGNSKPHLVAIKCNNSDF